MQTTKLHAISKYETNYTSTARSLTNQNMLRWWTDPITVNTQFTILGADWKPRHARASDPEDNDDVDFIQACGVTESRDVHYARGTLQAGYLGHSRWRKQNIGPATA